MKDEEVKEQDFRNGGIQVFTPSYVLKKVKEREFINVFNPKKILIKFEKTSECNLLNEYKEKYSYDAIFNLFLSGKTFKDLFLPLIDKYQYKRALDEYVKYGKIMYFPEDKIYQWLGIVIKNSLLVINSSIMHFRFTYVPVKFVSDTLLPFFFKNTDYSIIDDYTFSYTLPEEKYYDKINEDINKALYQRVFGKAILGNILLQNFTKKDESYLLSNTLPHFYTSLSNNPDENFPFFYAERKDDKIEAKIALPYINEKIGFFDWVGMDMYTEQMGLVQIITLLNELKDDMSPEEVLVWINRMLDIFHFREDLSKAFIKGGKKSLDEISNN